MRGWLCLSLLVVTACTGGDKGNTSADTGQIGDMLVATSADGTPVYLRSITDTVRGYQSPPRFLNYQTWQDDAGAWQRSRAISLAIDMRSGGQISKFGTQVESALETVKLHLPEDLLLFKTSNQPAQVRDSVDLFMTALYEAIILVVLVSLLGFWEWRSAVLMAISTATTTTRPYSSCPLEAGSARRFRSTRFRQRLIKKS